MAQTESKSLYLKHKFKVFFFPGSLLKKYLVIGQGEQKLVKMLDVCFIKYLDKLH